MSSRNGKAGGNISLAAKADDDRDQAREGDQPPETGRRLTGIVIQNRNRCLVTGLVEGRLMRRRSMNSDRIVV